MSIKCLCRVYVHHTIPHLTPPPLPRPGLQGYGPPPQLHGRLAYVPQAPIITNNTVRENIIFGRWVLCVRVWGGGA